MFWFEGILLKIGNFPTRNVQPTVSLEQMFDFKNRGGLLETSNWVTWNKNGWNFQNYLILG